MVVDDPGRTDMNRHLKTIALVLCIAAGMPAWADGHTASTLADILTGMNHFPSEADKAALSEVAADATVSDNLRAIADAIAGIAHTPTAEDQARLNGILASDSASAEEKTLAKAVLRFEHKLTVEDAAALESMTE
jgi:hypothetical protein